MKRRIEFGVGHYDDTPENIKFAEESGRKWRYIYVPDANHYTWREVFDTEEECRAYEEKLEIVRNIERDDFNGGFLLAIADECDEVKWFKPKNEIEISVLNDKFETQLNSEDVGKWLCLCYIENEDDEYYTWRGADTFESVADKLNEIAQHFGYRFELRKEDENE